MQRIHVTIRPLNREDSVLYFPPEAFGPFRVLHQIGAGALGPVFRAYEPAGDRLVAVKVFRLDLTPEQTAGLVAELGSLVAARINHPGIAAPIAVGHAHGAAYLAQEYAVGDSLDVVLRERGRLGVGEVVAVVASLARAIDYAADRGVHHQLLHPRDIVLSEDGVRVTGFGISSVLSNIGAKLPVRPQYSSPDVPSDVYALGAIAFEAVTGKRASADNLKELEAEYGSELRRAFELPLAANQEMRPARAADFAVALGAAAMGAENAMGAGGAMGAETASVAPIESAFPSEDQTPPAIAPTAPVAPLAPLAPDAPIAPDDPLDREIDLGASNPLELDVSSDFPREPLRPISTPAFPSPWVEPPSPALSTDPEEQEPTSRRWPIVAMFLAFALLVALSVGLFLRSPRPTPATEQKLGVDATVVDLPGSAPSPNTTQGKPAPNSPAARNAPTARNAPSPSPSRPASGAVRGAQTGSVLIRSTPADAEVLVNGKPRGKTPLALRDLALGSYTIRVARDGYATEERTLQLTARRPTTSTTINLRSAAARSASSGDSAPDASADKAGSGGLNVQSRPSGARVFVNNQLAGATPIAISDLPAGSATVRIEMDGYQPWTTTVSVGAGEQTKVAASLERQ